MCDFPGGDLMVGGSLRPSETLLAPPTDDRASCGAFLLWEHHPELCGKLGDGVRKAA